MGPLVVLAYSGGLDTSAIVPWLREQYGARVLCFVADVGQGTGELTGLVEKAKRSGAIDCVVEDLREEFVRDFVFRTLRAGAVYARTYLLGTGMARPVMAAHQVALAQRAGAQAVAHGCTGKGNDQVRFELTYAALAPELQVIAPWREWEFHCREDLIAYVKAKDIPVQATLEKPYSTDRNLCDCSHEGGSLEHAAEQPPEHHFAMIPDPLRARAAGARSPDAAPQGRAGAPLRRPGVRRAVVDPGAGGARRRRPEHPEARDRYGAAQTVQGRPRGGRAREPVRAVSAVVCHVRQGQRVRPARRRWIHPPVRPLAADWGRARRGTSAARSRGGGGLMAARPTEPAPPPPPAPTAPHQMWGGRFSVGPSEALDALNRSLPVDHRLWPQDVAASKAWVHALGRVGVVTPHEEMQLLEGLDRVAERLADGAAVGAPDEDVHTLVERLLYAEVGAVAGKLHTGRSRNDQVATDLRLWTLEAIDQVDSEVAALGRTLVARAQDGVAVLLPGYTHGQRAQPVRWAYVLLAHAWPLVRDRQRLADARRRVAELPLGSGALAGSGFPVDRVLLKEALGFRALCANALDATGDRDFVAEVLFALSLVEIGRASCRER